MSLHVLAVDSATDGRICIAIAIGVEWWLCEVRLKCRVGQPSRAQFQFSKFLSHFFNLLISQCVQLFFLDCLLKGGIITLDCARSGHSRGGSALLIRHKLSRFIVFLSLPNKDRIKSKLPPGIGYPIFKHGLVQFLWDLNASLRNLEVARLTCSRDFRVETMTSNRIVVIHVRLFSLLHGGVLQHLLAVFSRKGGEVFHQLFFDSISVDLLARQMLAFVLKVVNNLILLRFRFVLEMVTEVVLLLRDKVDSHFVDPVLLCEGPLRRCEIIFVRFIKLAPAKYF